MNERDTGSFIKTPLEFFGHSYEDIHFGFPSEYYEELEARRIEAEDAIAALEADRQEELELLDPSSEQYGRLTSPDEHRKHEGHIDLLRSRVKQGVNHKWYERRFRGRYESNVDVSKYPAARLFVRTTLYARYNPDEPTVIGPVPDVAEFAAYLNEQIVLNEWSSAYEDAGIWYETLPDDSPDKEVAKNYAAFAGSIIVHEYSRQAKALAEAELIDDDFFRLKHLITVCWPMVRGVERYAPEEAKRTKQFLREVFIEMVATGSESVRNEIERFGPYVLGQEVDHGSGFEALAKQERAATRTIMQFDSEQIGDIETTKQQVLYRAQSLAASQKWSQAIELLDMARYAFGLPLDEFQDHIRAYAVEAALHYTSDMSKFNERWPYVYGNTEFWTDNSERLALLKLSYGIDDNTYEAIQEIEDSRSLEYKAQQLKKAAVGRDDQKLWNFFDALASRPAEVAQRFADPEIVEKLIELVTSEQTASMSDASIDSIVEGIIKLRARGVITGEQHNNMIFSVADAVLGKAHDPQDGHETFHRFIGFISPILRYTTKSEDPKDETLWQVVSKHQFSEFIDTIINASEERNLSPESVAYFAEQKQTMLDDIRAAWSQYWKRREEY